MRILHVIPSVADIRGGTSRAVLDMVNALQDSALDVEIATTNDNGPLLLDVPLQQRVVYDQVPIRFFLRYSPSLAPIREFAFSWQFTRWLQQHIHDYDLVHIHAFFSYTSTFAMWWARVNHIPYVVTPHGLLCTWSLKQKQQKKQLYLELLERTNLNAAQAIHFTAQQEAHEAAPLHLKASTFVLPLGLPLPVEVPNAHQRLREELSLPEDEPIILFMSRLHPKKGLEYLIEALGLVKGLQFTFVLAGSGTTDYEYAIQGMLKSTGIYERTHMVGFVGGETKALLLQGADLFALTSYSENFGIVVLEALAGGTPVLLTPGVSLSTMVSEGNFGYISELDVSSIVTALYSFFEQRELAKEKGERARQFVIQNYAWKHMAAQMIDVYKAILDRKSLPMMAVVE